MMRFIAFSASVLDDPVSSVASASFLPLMPPAALISSTANSVPLRACVPSRAVLPVRAVVRPSGIGEGQLAGSALDRLAELMARQIAAVLASEFFINIDVIIFPVEWSSQRAIGTLARRRKPCRSPAGLSGYRTPVKGRKFPESPEAYRNVRPLLRS